MVTLSCPLTLGNTFVSDPLLRSKKSFASFAQYEGIGDSKRWARFPSLAVILKRKRVNRGVDIAVQRVVVLCGVGDDFIDRWFVVVIEPAT